MSERSMSHRYHLCLCKLTSYRFAAVKMGLRAMSVSTKVSIRTDGEGVLSMNFMIDIDGTNVFVEFRVLSLTGRLMKGHCEY